MQRAEHGQAELAGDRPHHAVGRKLRSDDRIEAGRLGRDRRDRRLHRPGFPTGTQYCSAAEVRFENCVDFASKRRFLVDHVTKVVFSNDRVEVHGAVPVRASHTDHDDAPSKLPFCIAAGGRAGSFHSIQTSSCPLAEYFRSGRTRTQTSMRSLLSTVNSATADQGYFAFPRTPDPHLRTPLCCHHSTVPLDTRDLSPDLRTARCTAFVR